MHGYSVDEHMESSGESDAGSDETDSNAFGSDEFDSDEGDIAVMDGNNGIPELDSEAGFGHVSAINDESHTPLFCGSQLSRLDATLMFMNVCRTHRASNACISEFCTCWRMLYCHHQIRCPPARELRAGCLPDSDLATTA
jgi:hypothetical protein